MKTALCPHCQSFHSPEGMVFDRSRYTITWPGGVIKLTPFQFRIVNALTQQRTRTKEALITAVWEERNEPGGPWRTIQVHIVHLRRLFVEKSFPGEIRTIWDGGYELVIHKPDQAAA